MSTATITTKDIATAILFGDVDDKLDYLASIIVERRKMLSNLKLRAIEVGDRVRYNNQTKPNYLVGATGTVTKINRTKVVVKLDQPTGRFFGLITTPVSLIDLID